MREKLKWISSAALILTIGFAYMDVPVANAVNGHTNIMVIGDSYASGEGVIEPYIALGKGLMGKSFRQPQLMITFCVIVRLIVGEINSSKSYLIFHQILNTPRLLR